MAVILEEEIQQQPAAYMRSRVYGADLDGTLMRLARIHLSFLDGDRERVYYIDSLVFPQKDTDKNAHEDIPLRSLDLIVGNPPYSFPVTDTTILHKYELARIWKR